MRIYLAIKYHADQENRAKIEQILAVFEQTGHQAVCVARDLERWGQVSFSPRELMKRSFAEIESSDVVVVELAEKGVGLGIEAGYARAMGIPVITVAPPGTEISPTLEGISRRVLFYREIDDLRQVPLFVYPER